MTPPPRGLSPREEVDALHVTVRGAIREPESVAPRMLVAWLAVASGLGYAATQGGNLVFIAGSLLLATGFILSLWRSARQIANLPDVETHIEHRLTMNEAGLKLAGPDHDVQLRPGRIAAASVGMSPTGQRCLRLELMFPPDILWVNAELHEERELHWLIEAIDERYCHEDEVDDQVRLREQASELKNRV